MTWDIILAGMIGGLGLGRFCVSMLELRRAPVIREVWRDPHQSDCGIRTRGICDCGEDRPGDDDIHRIVSWCQEKIDAAIRTNDARWIRRILK